MSNKKALQAWIKRNEKTLRAEYGVYGDNPNVDYCHGEGGCGHCHTFQAYAEREFLVEMDQRRMYEKAGA